MGNVLVACEESQVVCKAFRKLGHNAFSCDLLECSGGMPGFHILGDCRTVLSPRFNENDLTYNIRFITQSGDCYQVPKWDLIIAHPPCIFLSKAGARWLYAGGVLNEERYIKGLAAKQLFFDIWEADCPRVCIENPTPLKVFSLPSPSQIVQPYLFDEPYSKRTLLWERGLPLLLPTVIRSDYVPYCPSNTSLHSRGAGGSKGVASSSRDRSRTFEGVAAAMASQWGCLI